MARLTVAAALLPSAAPAAHAESMLAAAIPLAPDDLLYLALLGLLIGSAMLTSFWLIRQRANAVAENERLRADLLEARGEAETRTALLAADDQRIILFSGPGAPEVLGALPRETGAPAEARRFLAFDEWLPDEAAERLVTAIERLRALAEPFSLCLETKAGRPVEAIGRTLGASAAIRFISPAGLRGELAALRRDYRRVLATLETMQRLFDAAPMPVWLRDRQERLVWVNCAYASAVEVSAEEALSRQVEFFNERGRAAIAETLAQEGVFDNTLTAVVEADRRIFRVVGAAGPLGSAGLAADISETETVRMELRQTIQSHSETLDQLTTAVARFDEKTQLRYYNAAFQKLFGLTAAYLEGAPDHLSLLDHLRSAGVLPEDPKWRDWKEEIIGAYRATEPSDFIWHLADGRTLRVFASPQPQGGATWVFEDLTEKLELESRLNALVRLQGETLDCLNEGVAVFSQDGRLRLWNPIFAEIWGLQGEFLGARPHIRAIADSAVNAVLPAEDGGRTVSWRDFIQAVTAFDEGPREAQFGEFTLSDGTVKNYSVVPLPNGQTMLTFIDISDAREAERMLRERNEALELADRLKSDFVQHVNYELRSPLTNIIGFSALLRSPDTGSLNERQSEYLDYISTSSATLLTIVNDILDLATIDAGIMELELAEVDIARAAEHAAEGIRERLREHGVALEIDVSAAGRSFRADGQRVTQILFNLLSNAANFAPAGSTVRLKAWREEGDVVFSVSDQGPGIAPDALAKVFDRFQSDPAGGRQSGAGLGLSIVKSFVELHNGAIAIESRQGRGTTVICRFPTHELLAEEAAE